MEKDTLLIDIETFKILGIDPRDAIEYLESKHASTLKPVHVKALQLLKQQLVASS